jgi:hypothetical protein
MSRHQRLQKTMRNPARAARSAGKKHGSQRERAYEAHRLPLDALLELVKPWRKRSAS